MKGFAIFVIFAVMYILLVALFHGISAAEFTQGQGQGAGQFGAGGSGGGPSISPSNSKPPRQNVDPNGTGNPIVDVFQIEDPVTKNMLDAAYGTYHGDDQCRRKSACILGNYMKDLPGRDLMFIFMGGYIPQEYSLFYDIFRNSALYGQNCDVYVCIAKNQVQGQIKEAQTQAQPSFNSIVV